MAKKSKVKSCSEFIEELKEKLAGNELTSGERRAVESELHSAYVLFYNYSKEEDALASVYNTEKETFISKKENAQRSGSSLNHAKSKARLAITRLYQVAKVIEEKYCVDLNSAKIIRMITPEEDVVPCAEIEAIEE